MKISAAIGRISLTSRLSPALAASLLRHVLELPLAELLLARFAVLYHVVADLDLLAGLHFFRANYQSCPGLSSKLPWNVIEISA